MKKYDWLMQRLEMPFSDKCEPWPYGKNTQGYGVVYTAQGIRLVHRISLANKLERELTQRECALHACDNPPCFNPLHLRPGSKQDNENDKCSKGRHTVGERNGRAKLTSAHVRQIFELRRAGLTLKSIADSMGLSKSHVGNILTATRWKHLT